MFSVYYNPQAKRFAIKFIISSMVVLILISVLAWLINQHYKHLFTQQATQLFAISKTNGSLIDYFNGIPLSHEANLEANRLMQLQFAPKQWQTPFPIIMGIIVVIWFIVTIIRFLLLTHSLHAIFKRISHIQQFTTHFFSEDKPLDIRSNEQGIISSLENDIYHVATELHTRLYTNKQQKEYLSKNLADISHQLKTPLTALLVVNDTLLSLPIDKRTDEQLLLLEPQLMKIEQLIQKILILTRLDASALILKTDSFLINDLIATIMSEFHVLLSQKNITVTTDIPKQVTICADYFYIKEAISNIIKNAIDHTDTNGIITVSVEDTIFSTTINLFNSGTPIDTVDLPYIFQRFYRGKNASPTSVGIGLSVAYEIIALHQGKLTAENTNDGVLFSLTLPK